MAVVGRIARAHGIRGQVIVNAETDFPEERFRPGSELFATAGGQLKTLVVTAARFHQGRPVIALEGVDDMNAAIALAGTELRVPVGQLLPLPDGTFYRHDLIGCAVESTTGAAIGVVSDVEGPSSRSRLVVATDRGALLVPLVEAICPVVDPAGRRIVVDPPAGLLDLNMRE